MRSLAAVLTSPKNLITALITLVLVVGEWSYGVVGGYEKLAVVLGTAVACEVGLSLYLLGRFPSLSSAYISGISLTILLRPQAGLWWPFVVGPALAIGSKYVLRAKGRHLWNPSNFAIAALVLLAPGRVAVLSHEFGNDLAANAVIWVFGVLIAWRARILHVSAAYVAAFVALAWARSLLVGTPFRAEVAPLTGPMYQLMIFFMLTDPRTSVSTKRGRVIAVVVVACVEMLIRLGNDFDVAGAAAFAPAPTILALAFVGPAALYLDLLRRERARSRAEAPRPARPTAAAPRRPAPLTPAQLRAGRPLEPHVDPSESPSCSSSRSTAPAR